MEVQIIYQKILICLKVSNFSNVVWLKSVYRPEPLLNIPTGNLKSSD